MKSERDKIVMAIFIVNFLLEKNNETIESMGSLKAFISA